VEEDKMKVPTIVAVMVLGAASMMAQAAASGTAAAAPDASKPAEHAACKHEMAKTGTKKACHCMKNKDGKMACPHMKKEAETKS
jgi:hypothetical protein